MIHVHTIYPTYAEADYVASLLNEDAQSAGDGWTYIVLADPQGSDSAIIAIYDEDGQLVGYL